MAFVEIRHSAAPPEVCTGAVLLAIVGSRPAARMANPLTARTCVIAVEGDVCPDREVNRRCRAVEAAVNLVRPCLAATRGWHLGLPIRSVRGVHRRRHRRRSADRELPPGSPETANGSSSMTLRYGPFRLG